MKKTLAPIIFTILTLTECVNTNSFNITGSVIGYDDSTMLYLEDVDNQKTVDSTYILNGEFVFNREISEAAQFVIRTDFKNRENFEYVFFWAEPGNMTLKGEKGKLKSSEILGSKLQDQSNLFIKLRQPLDEKMDSLYNIYMSSDRNDTAKINALRKEHQKIQDETENMEIRFIKEHPDFEISAFQLTYLMKNISKDTTQKLYDALDENVKTTNHGKTVKKFLELSREFKIGDQIADIQLPNVENNYISLSDLKGKYVLVDFWGSGCGPCRMENPNLLRAYRKYKEKGFEIFGVSMDTNQETWEKTLQSDSMIWINVCDLNGFNSDVALTYNLRYIPRNFLIDQEGIIIAEDLRGNQLEEKLDEIFMD